MENMTPKGFILTCVIICIIIMAIGFTVWLFPPRHHNVIEQEYFIVDEINEKNGKATYYLVHKPTSSTHDYHLLVIDEINKYDIGDTIIFSKFINQ